MKVNSLFPFLEAQTLTVKTQGGSPVCQQLSLRIQTGECWVLLGENGVGKTTLLHTLAAIQDSYEGEVLYAGKKRCQYTSRQFAQYLAYLPQHPTYPPEQRVRDILLSARYPYHPFWHWHETAQDCRIVDGVAEQFELSHLIGRRLSELSGGERQRIAIASAVAQTSTVLLMDEPTAFLDVYYQHRLFTCLTHYRQQEGMSMVIALQDPNLALQYATHGLLLFGDGQWCAGQIETVLTEENACRLYHYPLKRSFIQNRWLLVPVDEA